MTAAITRLDGAPARPAVSVPARPALLRRAVVRAHLSPEALARLLAVALAGPMLGAGVAVVASAVAGLLTVAATVGFVVATLVARRSARDQALAAEAMDLLARCARHLRAGGTLTAALRSTATAAHTTSTAVTSKTETSEAMTSELATLRGSIDRVVAAIDLGAPLVEALNLLDGDEAVAEVTTARLALGVASTGGRPAEALDAAAQALRMELQLRGEVRALTAQARLSAQVLVLLPLGFLVLGAMAGASQTAALWSTPAGRACLIAGIALDVVGGIWLARQARSVTR